MRDGMELFAAYPLVPERWDVFVALFGPSGACYSCWCTYFECRHRNGNCLTGAAMKEFIRRRIEPGPPPGMLGYVGGQPIAWVQVGPRADVPQWKSPRTVSRPLEAAEAQDPSVWAVSCFFIGSRHRGKGDSHRMVDVAIRFARESEPASSKPAPWNRRKHRNRQDSMLVRGRFSPPLGFGSRPAQGWPSADAA
jgi:predicted GNAT family acetyltransferase